MGNRHTIWQRRLFLLFIFAGTTRPICVLDNKKGWWLDCGLRDSYLLRIKDFGGITARFDFALGVGDEKGFPHSIRNTDRLQEEDPYEEVRPPSPHPALKYPYEAHRLYSRSSKGHPTLPPPPPSRYGDQTSTSVKYVAPLPDNIPNMTVPPSHVPPTHWTPPAPTNLTQYAPPLGVTSISRSSERRWSQEHPSIIPDQNKKGVWVRLPMQQVLKNGKPVGIRYLNRQHKRPRVPMRPPVVHNATAAVPVPNIVTIGGKKYQMFVPPGAQPVPIMPMGGGYWPQHPVPMVPQQPVPMIPHQHPTKDRASHSGTEMLINREPPPLVSKLPLLPPPPAGFKHPHPPSLRVPTPPLEVTREQFKSPPAAEFQPVKFRPHVESFRSPPPLPDHFNEVDSFEDEFYDGPVIGELLGEILQLPPDTPADSDHVPSFAAQQLVVRDAPRNMHPPGYKANSTHAPPPKTRLPRTKFFCEEREFLPGLYADVQLGCKIFHLCVPAALGSTIQSFLCPNSTLFDQSILQCNYWQLVDCSLSPDHYSANQPLALSYRRVNAAHLPPQQAANPLTLSMLSDFRVDE